MSLSLVFGAIVVFWIWVYYQRSKSRRRNHTLLPLTATPREVNNTRDWLWKGTIGNSTVDIGVAGFLLLRMSTNLLISKDRWPQNTLTRSRFTNRDSFSEKGYSRSKFLRQFYNFGFLSAIIGQLLTIGALWWSAFVLLQRYYRFFVPESTVTAGNFVKRGLTTLSADSTEVTRNSIPRLIVPGVNVPLSHIYPIVVALVLCTGIHELGHAIAASLENIPVARWGYNLFAVIPTAFVEIVPPQDQSSTSRLRIASAGVFHNLITLSFLFLLSSLQIGQYIFPLLGYTALDNGVKVMGVVEDSPLSQYIPSGATITQLDDIPIKPSFGTTTLELWSDILANPSKINHDTIGWCIQPSLFHGRSSSCCYSLSSHQKGSCFTLSDETKNSCIDPLFMFEKSEWPRCGSDIDCANGDICVQPHPSISLTRIMYQHSDAGGLKTVVWNGPRQEIWEQLIVDDYEPWISFLPSSLPFWLKLLTRYITTVSISLFLFNLLPIRVLDGGEIFLAGMDWVSPKSRTTESYDLESGAISRTTTAQGKRILLFLERTTIIYTICLAISSFK